MGSPPRLAFIGVFQSARWNQQWPCGQTLVVDGEAVLFGIDAHEKTDAPGDSFGELGFDAGGLVVLSVDPGLALPLVAGVVLISSDVDANSAGVQGFKEDLEGAAVAEGGFPFERELVEGQFLGGEGEEGAGIPSRVFFAFTRSCTSCRISSRSPLSPLSVSLRSVYGTMALPTR